MIDILSFYVQFYIEPLKFETHVFSWHFMYAAHSYCTPFITQLNFFLSSQFYLTEIHWGMNATTWFWYQSIIGASSLPPLFQNTTAVVSLVIMGWLIYSLAECELIHIIPSNSWYKMHFSAHILKYELVCKFGMMEWDFIYLLLFLALVHGFMHEIKDFFNSIITFSYTKCFVQSYTIDVVFTLSYW